MKRQSQIQEQEQSERAKGSRGAITFTRGFRLESVYLRMRWRSTDNCQIYMWQPGKENPVVEEKCELCGSEIETLEYLVNGCGDQKRNGRSRENCMKQR